jgi:hypothetical protein
MFPAPAGMSIGLYRLIFKGTGALPKPQSAYGCFGFSLRRMTMEISTVLQNSNLIIAAIVGWCGKHLFDFIKLYWETAHKS